MNTNILKGIWISLTLSLVSCQNFSKEQQIIDRAIEAHGGEAYKNSRISFDFRDIHYEIFKSPDRFEYSREFTDSLGVIKDVLDNQGFTRTINGQETPLTDERRGAFSRSVNSVAYFAFLPYGLNDAAAQKAWVGESELEGNSYDVIQVTFSKNGGGEDFDDEFLYWINQENDRMDYMAYTYQTDGGGMRFRKAIHSRVKSGIRMQDYANYKPLDENIPLEEIEDLFKNGKLELLSEIVLENIQVEFLE